MKKMLFISLDWYRTKDPKIPLALGSIQAHYQSDSPQGMRAEFVSYDLANEDFSLIPVLHRINSFQPHVLALSCYIWNEREVQEILAYVGTHHPETVVVLGGPQITYGGPEVADEYAADWLIRGYGERPFTHLMKYLCNEEAFPPPDRQTLGVYRRAELRASIKPRIHVENNLASLPSPFLTQVVPVEQNAPFQRWETLRGCPYRCSFCQFKIDQMKPKAQSHQKIFQELELFHQKGVKEIAVLDPIFNFREEHYLPILEKIDELEMQAHFSFQTRLELLTKDHGIVFLEWCKRYKNVKLEFGVQTFNAIESKQIKRNNHLSQINKGLRLLKEYDIDFELHLIFGLPYQTASSFWESYALAVEARPNRLFAFPLNLLKGTDLLDKHGESDYSYDPDDYNIFTSSKWMNEKEVSQLKGFAAKLNQASKDTPYGQKVRLPKPKNSHVA